MRKLALVVLLLLGHRASADSPFAVLANANAKWSYDVVKGKKHESVGQATIAVTGVHVVGPYTVIDLETTLPEKYSIAVAAVRDAGLRLGDRHRRQDSCTMTASAEASSAVPTIARPS